MTCWTKWTISCCKGVSTLAQRASGGRHNLTKHRSFIRTFADVVAPKVHSIIFCDTEYCRGAFNFYDIMVTSSNWHHNLRYRQFFPTYYEWLFVVTYTARTHFDFCASLKCSDTASWKILMLSWSILVRNMCILQWSKNWLECSSSGTQG